MNTFETQLRDIAQQTSLSPEAKARIRERVLEYTEYKPLRQASGFHVDYTFVYTYLYRTASVALVIALVVGGAGTAYAAEGALPGDALYGVKELTEAVRAQVAVTPEDKTAWDIERANRRLQEARALAARDALTPEREAYLTEQFSTLAQSAETQIQAMPDPDVADALSVELSAGVAAHERALHVALESAPAVAARAAVVVSPDDVAKEQPEHPLVAAVARVRVAKHRERVPEEPTVMLAAKVSETQSTTASVEPLKRAVARQEARLKKESKAAKEPRAQQDAQATLSAIAQVEQHIETVNSETAPVQALDSVRQEKNEDTHEPQNERAFLEAALYEVHNARVRLQEEGERVRDSLPEVRVRDSIDD